MNENRMKLPLFDDYWIDFRIGTVRRWFAPERVGLVPGGAYASLLYDPNCKKYRIYYEVMTSDLDAYRVLKCQQSEDLVHFEPLLNDEGGDVLFDGETGLHGCSVLYDPFDEDASRRYKCAGMFDMAREAKGLGDWLGVEVATSPDGVHWTRHPEYKVCKQTSDALNKITYNPLTKEYCIFHRAGYVDRRVSITRSRDLINWTEPRVILQPGPNYNDGFTGMQHYSMTGNFFDGIFYGVLWRFNTNLYDKEFTRMWGYMEPELVYSYDGQEYLYTSGKALVERPYAPEPGACGLCPQDLCEDPEHKNYYLLCSGALYVHGTEATNITYSKRINEMKIKCGAPLYKIRKDGFCGIESVSEGGLVITKGICLIKDDLAFNVRANLGTVRFGIMDLKGNYLEGFSLDDCEPYGFDDGVEVKPKWKNHELKEVIGQRIRVVIELNTAMLHCISATARPNVRQKQTSFARPSAYSDDMEKEFNNHWIRF